jgi:hypothetical protein
MTGFDCAAARALIARQVRDLRREVTVFLAHLQSAPTPPELIPYQRKLETLARSHANDLQQIECDLARGMDELIEDLRSATAQVTQAVQILTRRLAAPLVAPTLGDRVAARLIQWIHQTNSSTAVMPAACCDGEPSVYPFVLFAPLYAFPRLVRQGLLYLPIFFHEFGHVLYRQHLREMVDLVRELQQWIADQLEPLSIRNDVHASQQRELQRNVVDTWYSWAQEFYCDAVGLVMSGPAYLHAFASYVARLEYGDFRRSPEDLAHSSHPVLWLRVRLLTERARRLGFSQIAVDYDRNWNALAGTLNVNEDFFGYFESSWQPKIESVLADMLTETQPRAITAAEVEGTGEGEDSPAALLNLAWRVFLDEPNAYDAWEQSSISEFLR